MDLLKKTHELCARYNIKPNRSRGQNFLISEKKYENIVNYADLKKDDVVLEIGPGLGFLTEKIAQKVKKVIAVELDKDLIKILKIRMDEEKIKNVEIINEDILEIENPKSQIIEKLKNKNSKFKIVTNLPYNITSIFLRKFLSEETIRPESMVLMLQKEVAERIVAKPSKMSLLAVSAQFYADPEIMEYVGKENFFPSPEVDSAIIKLKVKNKKLEINEKKFFQMVKFGFSAKRKMLKNNLSAGFRINQIEAEKIVIKANFNPKVRAQELSLKDWMRLFDFILRI